MKILDHGETQDYWFNGLVAKCPECGQTVEFGPCDLSYQRHGWFGDYMEWRCGNITCDTTLIRTLRKPWWTEVFDDLYAEAKFALTNKVK